MEQLTFIQSRDIKDYKPILEQMVDVWDYDFYPYILTWCRIIHNDPEDLKKYWRVWIITTEREETVGICGSYSLNDTTEELWGGWGGLIPDYRNQG